MAPMKTIGIGIALLAAASAARAEWNSLLGKEAPSVTVESWINPAEGETLEDLRGRVILLEFWATW